MGLEQWGPAGSGWPPAPCTPPPLCLPSGIKGWFSPYHRKHQFGNPRNMESFGSKLLKYVGCRGAGAALGPPPPFEEVPVSPWGSRSQLSLPSPHPRLHEDWESLVRELRAQLESIYFPDTVEEWMEENVNPYLDQLRDLVRDYRAIIRLNARPKAS